MSAPPPDRDALVLRWHRWIYQLAIRYARYTGGDADDLAAEIAAAALRDFDRFDPARSQYQTWLGHVARTVAARSRHRDLRRVPTVSGHARGLCGRGDELLASVADPAAEDPADVAAGRDDRRHAEDLAGRLLAVLPPRQRRALSRRFGLAPGGWSCNDLEADAARDGLARLRALVAAEVANGGAGVV